MKVAVASGKGGTGKSTVSVNLAYMLADSVKDVCLVDCDVEEPNCHLFVRKGSGMKRSALVSSPRIDVSVCSGCQKCVDFCSFNALAYTGTKVMLFPELCHSCGGCVLICPEKAISEANREIGVIAECKEESFNLVWGELAIGEPKSPPLIRQVRQKADSGMVQIIDCPPGTSCPAVSAVKDTDHVLLIAEPTLFGLHDLDLLAQVVKKMGIEHSIVVNKSGSADYLIEDYAKEHSIPVLARIPFDLTFMEAGSSGEILAKKYSGFKDYLEPVLDFIRKALH